MSSRSGKLAQDHLTADERETVVIANDGSDTIRISTYQRSVIAALRRKPHAFTETASGYHGGTEWAEFVLSVKNANWGALAKRRGSPRPGAARNLTTASMTVSTERDGSSGDEPAA